jgi:adenosylcobinamide kinase/adenosylcobinamide-phosphate guanylyltransferase
MSTGRECKGFFMTHPQHELVTGGARSGKSRYAEALALQHSGSVLYVATAERYPDDAEFAERVRLHRERRPSHWVLAESGPELAATLAGHDAPGRLLLVDCLGMWLMRFFEGDDLNPHWPRERAALLSALAELRGQAVLVSNEIGWGVVGGTKLTRRFVDELGWLNQAVAERCARVTLVACGLPLPLKGAAA